MRWGTPVAFLVQVELKSDFKNVVSGLFRNVVSSRSHSILQLLVEQHWVEGGSKKRRCCAKLNIVDLAGSEKWNVMQVFFESSSLPPPVYRPFPNFISTRRATVRK